MSLGNLRRQRSDPNHLVSHRFRDTLVTRHFAAKEWPQRHPLRELERDAILPSLDRVRNSTHEESDAVNKIEYRDGAATDAEECLILWVDACLARDGAAVVGVAERARPKFDDSECWIVADDTSTGIVGFGLATKPGSGLVGDPPAAPVIGLLAVAPDAQGRGLGANLLMALTTELALRGYDQSVLHVLADHDTAVHLYEKMGWRQLGGPFPHSLLRRATQAYVFDLNELSAR